MKRALARLLRRGADRIDPLPKFEPTEGVSYTMSITGPEGFYTEGGVTE